jgi:hypothetical protein
LARSGVIGDAREAPADLDGGGQLAVAGEYLADGVGVGFGDQEHGAMMVICLGRGNRARRIQPGALSPLA